MRQILVFTALALSLFTVVPSRGATYEQGLAAITAKKGKVKEGTRLKELFDLTWQHGIDDSPEAGTNLGYNKADDRWDDRSLEAAERRHRELDAVAAATDSFNASRLSEADRLNLELFRYDVKEHKSLRRFPEELMPVSQLSGIQQELAQVLEIMPAATEKDYRNILARLEKIPGVVDQVTAVLKEGIRRGIVPARIAIRDVPDQIKAQAEEDPEKSPLLAPFRKFPSTIPEEKRAELKQQAAAILKTKAAPAFAAFHDFFVKSYLPACREEIARTSLPNGAAWYDALVANQTTTELTAKQVHEKGLAEVARIRTEMEKVIKESGFKGDFADFCKFLRSDSQFFYTDADELVRGYRNIAKQIDPGLIRLFGRLPRLTYGVLPVPSYDEKSQTTGYYEPGSLRAGRPGYFYANTYALDTRPKWEMEALTLHEAVPGHHLQIALNEEMETAPEFRRHGGYTAFVEGWGLYAESLGYDLGMFKTPYTKFGQLTYEMWRAIRLVVDTGMHSMSWSRKHAIDYFKENSPKTEHDITVEIDRYITWPGQALGYKIGQLKIAELRDRAKRALGDRFDIRAFHDTVLRNGPMPISLLERELDRWIASQKSAGNGART